MIVLDSVLGVAAVLVGAYLAFRGRALATGRLQGTLKTLLWPGLILMIVGGGSLLAAAGLLVTDVQTGRLLSLEGGVVLAGWGAMMLVVTGYRHWLQIVPLALGIVVIILAFTIPVPG